MPRPIMISDTHYYEMKEIKKTMAIKMSFDTLLGKLIYAGVKLSGSHKLFGQEIRKQVLHVEIRSFINKLHDMDLLDREVDDNDVFVPLTLILKGAWTDLYFLIEQKATMLGELGDQLAVIRKNNKPAKKRGRPKK